jgi:dienelactone hydrolase
VLVPALISREIKQHNGRAMLTNREYVYRSAFVLGRHVIGYEIQKVLAGVDWFAHEAESQSRRPRIGVVGYGEGGMLALYAAALDPRIDVTVVSSYFGPRDQVWEEPLDRNVFGRLREFGDAELASMVAPRELVIEVAPGPEVTLSGEGGAPARLRPAPRNAVEAEVNRARALAGPLWNEAGHKLLLVESGPFGSREAIAALVPDEADQPHPLQTDSRRQNVRPQFDPAPRQQRQVEEIDRHNQWLLRESPFVRKEFMKDLDTSSLESYQRSIEPYREFFRDNVIGRFDSERLPPLPRSRKVWETDKWCGYEVVLDVFPIEPKPGGEGDPGSSNVIAYGVLLVPKDLNAGEQRPVVVCQHGLEGRPTDTFLNDHRAYHDFAAKLCERGFITFAPQNLYIFRDRFRSLQRKANPLGKTLFSIIVPQHQQIVDWLQTLPFVDPERIAFYGLSYGGKSAMRIPALVPDYCLSICSADFNEWVLKNASTRDDFSYVWTGEYEIFEWDLGSTFNSTEMAALICPRPFMVERGHFDGVGTDEWVAYEFAKVRRLYQAQLGIGDRCEIEWFVGPHTINGQGTFAFLHRHLDWPRP